MFIKNKHLDKIIEIIDSLFIIIMRNIDSKEEIARIMDLKSDFSNVIFNIYHKSKGE